jgi:hypothetical protein
MRNSLLGLCLILLFVACTKNSEKNNQQPVLIDVYWDGALQSIAHLEYDNLQRIKKITNTSAATNNQQYEYISTYDYYSDSVVVVGPNTRTTYLLSNTGLANSAVKNFIENPHGLGFDYTYIYDANGYLIQKREIFSQVAGGNLVMDTSFFYYTIANGNVTKESGTQSTDRNFEYSSTPTRGNIDAFTTLGAEPFLGKTSVNLVSTTKDNSGQVTSTYDYDFDFKGRIKSKTIHQTAPGDKPMKYVYHYDD